MLRTKGCAWEQVFAEVVLGLGEAIVSGLVPGAALSFKAPKSALDKPEVGTYLNICLGAGDDLQP